MNGKKPTLYDVAEAAGVTHMTVSRAFAQKHLVAKKTLEKIMKIADEMGYYPNYRARSFASGQTKTIGLVYAQEAPFVTGLYNRLLHEIAIHLHQLGYDLLFITALGDRGTWDHKLRDDRIDGCIVIQPRPMDIDKVLQGRHIPAVMMNLDTDLPLNHIMFDDIEGGRLAAQHLIDLGHRELTYVFLKKHLLHPSIESRKKGIMKAVKKAGKGYSCSARYIEKEKLMKVILDQKPRPTGIIFYCDEDAVYFVGEAAKKGFKIPQDFSIIGFNNDEIDEVMVPSLSSIALPAEEMAQKAIEILMHNIETQQQLAKPAFVKLKPSLIQRDSTAKIK